MKSISNKSINMIYCDPPFFTQKTHKARDRNNKEYSFSDNWNQIEDYYEFLVVRLIEMNRILTDDGLIFIHCDRSASHIIRLALDKTFGENNFQSEIIWRYKRWSNSKKGLLNNHQTIYMYSKSKDFKFNTLYGDYSATTNVDQIMQERTRASNNKTVYKLDKNGNPVIGKPKKGVPLSDVWDIPYLNPKAKERVGYPTQKPILLLERIIEISTDEGDIVLDPFCGSGTTLVASKLLNRKYIGFDISQEAVDLTKKRLDNPVKTNSNLVNNGIDSYKTKSEQELSILNSIGANVVQRNKAVDGYLQETINGLPIPVRIQKPDETIYEIVELMESSKKTKDCELKIIVQTFSEGLLPNYQLPDDFHCIKSYDYAIKNLINKVKKQTDCY